MDKSMKICLTADANYMQHLVVTMSSILIHAEFGENVEFLILTDGSIDHYELKGLVCSKDCKIEIINAAELLNDHLSIARNPKWPLAIYYRLLLPHLCNAERIIYLDCDVVVRKSLRTLWEIPMDGLAIAGVPDTGFPHRERLLGLGVRIDGPYLNSGVLLLNLDHMRSNDFDGRMGKVSNEFVAPDFPDQDWINILFHHEKRILPLEWNAMSHVYTDAFSVEPPHTPAEVEQALGDPAICHFTNIKPWAMTYTAHPFWMEYWNCLAKTGYSRLRYKGAFKRVFLNEPDSFILRVGRMLRGR